MARHELPDGAAPPVDTSKTVEVKVIVSSLTTLAASIAYAVLDAIARHPDVLSTDTDWLRFIAIAAIPPVLAFLAGWAVPSNRM